MYRDGSGSYIPAGYRSSEPADPGTPLHAYAEVNVRCPDHRIRDDA